MKNNFFTKSKDLTIIRLALFCFLLVNLQIANACNNSAFSVTRTVGVGTTTFTFDLDIELGGGDGSYYGFAIQFLGGTTPDITSFSPSSISSTGGLSGTIVGLTDSDVNSIGNDSDLNQYDNSTNSLTYESSSNAAFNDFSTVVTVTVSGVIDQVKLDLHWNSVSCKHFIDIADIAILPVELSRFQATKKEQTVILDWQTATEINNEGFELQRSSDNKTWETIDFIEGNGHSNVVNNYEYQDRYPHSGINYYRLKQMDFDGAFEYSEVVSVRIENNEGNISVYPNPVRHDFTLTINAENAGEGQIQVFDYSGKAVLSQHAVLESGLNQLPIVTNDLQKGIYLVQVTYANEITKTVKFIKQ